MTADAMSGLATGAKGNEREQDVHTPDCILDVVRQTFGTIVCDPCGSRTREPFAECTAYEDDNGLSGDWPEKTYWNPPYKDLKAWLAHAAKQTEHIGLYPVRTNREWWNDYHADKAALIAWLKPLKFVGHKGAFPAPLVLVYCGTQHLVRFETAMLKSGLAHMVTPNFVRL